MCETRDLGIKMSAMAHFDVESRVKKNDMRARSVYCGQQSTSMKR